MFDSLSSSLVSKFPAMEQLEQAPDVLEEYFYLCSRALKMCPTVLLRGSDCVRIVQVIQMGIQGLKIPHKDAQRAILDFFEVIVSIAGMNIIFKYLEFSL